MQEENDDIINGKVSTVKDFLMIKKAMEDCLEDPVHIDYIMNEFQKYLYSTDEEERITYEMLTKFYRDLIRDVHADSTIIDPVDASLCRGLWLVHPELFGFRVDKLIKCATNCYSDFTNHYQIYIAADINSYIDIQIAPIVYLLNKKGYKTNNSCQGTGLAKLDLCNDGLEGAHAYITFEENFKFVVSTPKGMELQTFDDSSSFKCGIYSKSLDVQVALGPYLFKHMYEWAQGLPDV